VKYTDEHIVWLGRPSVCDLVSAAEHFDGFLWSLVQELFKKKFRPSLSFTKVSPLTAVLYLGAWMNIYPYFFPYSWPN